MRYRWFHYIHAEGTSRAVTSLCFALLRSELIILIKFSFLLNELISIAKHDFKSMLHKMKKWFKKWLKNYFWITWKWFNIQVLKLSWKSFGLIYWKYIGLNPTFLQNLILSLMKKKNIRSLPVEEFSNSATLCLLYQAEFLCTCK